MGGGGVTIQKKKVDKYFRLGGRLRKEDLPFIAAVRVDP
jgi:hypothetical protein